MAENIYKNGCYCDEENIESTNEILHCTNCGINIDPEETEYFDGLPYCPDCINERTFICDECGRRFLINQRFGNDSLYLCERCFDNYYTTCSECGCLINNDSVYYDDEDRALCQNCYNHIRYDTIHDYSYKPEPIFYGDDDNMYIGVELEIDGGGKDYDNAEKILDIANEVNELIYIKSDGSLDEGMEIVTHPMTLKYHIEEMPWNMVLKEAVALGYLSHKTSTCGLHCHVSRLYFGSTYKEQEKNIGKLLFMVEKYWDELLRFSRRTRYQMDRWAARYGFKEKPHQVLDNAKKSGLGRYACVNLTNLNTIEFRMWRGTLKYNTLIATLQLVKTLCKVAVSMSEEDLEGLSWTRFVEKINYPELIKYLKERRLYINDEVAAEEEY